MKTKFNKLPNICFYLIHFIPSGTRGKEADEKDQKRIVGEDCLFSNGNLRRPKVITISGKDRQFGNRKKQKCGQSQSNELQNLEEMPAVDLEEGKAKAIQLLSGIDFSRCCIPEVRYYFSSTINFFVDSITKTLARYTTPQKIITDNSLIHNLKAYKSNTFELQLLDNQVQRTLPYNQSDPLEK
jgi:hypothetical protein